MTKVNLSIWPPPIRKAYETNPLVRITLDRCAARGSGRDITVMKLCLRLLKENAQLAERTRAKTRVETVHTFARYVESFQGWKEEVDRAADLLAAKSMTYGELYDAVEEQLAKEAR